MMIRKYLEPMRYVRRIYRPFRAIRKQIIDVLHAKSIPIDRNDKKICALKDKYRGRRGFVLGNGPSLRLTDLDLLKNELTIAANKVFLCFRDTDWRPTFYNIEDDRIVASSSKQINAMHGVHKLLRRFDPNPWTIDDSTVLYDLVVSPSDIFPQFSWNPLEGIYLGYTVTYASLQWACYLGFNPIYLLGVDFDYPNLKHNDDGTVEIVSPGTHFVQGYGSPGEKFWAPKLNENLAAYALARQQAERRGVTIQNATRGGKLEVFDRVDFDSLFTPRG